jgi:hypothetical protein
MEDKTSEVKPFGVMAPADRIEEIPSGEIKKNTNRDQQEMAYFGKAQQLKARYL